MAYNINFQALALWIGLAAVIGGGYFVFSNDAPSQQTSFSIDMDNDTVPGELTRLTVEQDGEPVQGANVSIEGEFIGTTNSQGIKGFETPEDDFTVEASKGEISSETTFTVEDGSFSSPDDSEDSDGDGEDEDSSDSSDSDDEDSSDGSDNDSEDSDNQDSNQDSSEDDQQDSSDTVDDFTGIELDEEPMIGELRTLTVYDTGEKVSGAEVTVNGEVVGTTNAGGTVTFGVPNAAEVSVSTDTGLSETFTVQDYTEDDQNQTDDQNDTEEDLTTGIKLDSNPVSGTNNRIILYDQGDRVSGETVYLDGEELGQTGSNGAIEFEVPLQEQITVSTDYDLESQTFNVTEDHPEPDITLLSPDDGSTFDTVQGETTDIDFEASVEITENSGTASVMIDGSEVYTQDLSQGENTISTTQALSGGSHSWNVKVDTQEFDTASSSRGFTVNEVEVEDGLSLQTTPPTAGEYNYVRLYDQGEPVNGEEITVNSDSIGTTDSNGEVGFEVPNTQEITVSASGYSDITRTVEGYTEEIDMSFSFSETIYQGRSNTLTVTDQENGNALSSATVYANGVEQGQTNSSGQITFTIPEENSVTVKAVKENSDDNQSFAAEVPPLRFSVDSPKDGQSFGSYKASFNLEVNSTSQGTLDISIDGTNRLSESISSGQNTFNNDFVIENSGTHDFTISASNQEESRQITGTFNTTEDVPPPSIFIDAPSEGASWGGSRASIRTRIDSVEPFEYDIKVNSKKITEGIGESGLQEFDPTAYCLEPQQHQLEVGATGQEYGKTSTKTISFETTGTPPALQKKWSKPTKNEEVQSPVKFNYTVVGCQDSVNYNVYVKQGGTTIQTIDSGTLNKYQISNAPDQDFSLSSGDYTFVLEGQNQISFPFSVQ
jgi:hypothetical protein